MKLTVIGATGLIGSKVVDLLKRDGHDVVAASRASGADVLTGEGLADVLTGADVLVDVTNSPSFDDGPVMDFFTRSSANLVAAAKDSGIGHYVALSIVGADGLPESGYMRAKVATGEGDRRVRAVLHDRAGHPVPRIRRSHHGIIGRR
jgi:uncharacterized protein YbjT (DUF2867 family)